LENTKGIDHSEDLGVHEMDIKEIGCEGVSWLHPLQDRDQWLSRVNTVKEEGREFE
jgi:hypothetical protein